MNKSKLFNVVKKAEDEISQLLRTQVKLGITLVLEGEQKIEPPQYKFMNPNVLMTAKSKSLLNLVSSHFRLTEASLKSKDKSQKIVIARQAYLYLGDKLLKMKYADMAFHLNRERTTALDQLRKAQSLVEVRDELALHCEVIEKKFLTPNK
jgi:chromosomal replication initiation ATPase DnaA